MAAHGCGHGIRFNGNLIARGREHHEVALARAHHVHENKGGSAPPAILGCCPVGIGSPRPPLGQAGTAYVIWSKYEGGMHERRPLGCTCEG